MLLSLQLLAGPPPPHSPLHPACAGEMVELWGYVGRLRIVVGLASSPDSSAELCGLILPLGLSFLCKTRMLNDSMCFIGVLCQLHVVSHVAP